MDSNLMNTDLSKLCRFCLKSVSDDEKIKVGEIMRKQFKIITNTELILNKVNYSCKRCSYDIRKSSVIKTRLLRNQKRLFELIENADQEDQNVQIKFEMDSREEADDITDIKKEFQEVNFDSNFENSILNRESSALDYHQIQRYEGSDPERLIEDSLNLAKRSKVVNYQELDNFSDTEEAKNERKAKRIHSMSSDFLKGKERVMCEDCGNYFTKSSLRNHRLRKHSKELPKFECDLCDRKFFRKGELKDHITIHSGIKELSCHICFKMYGTRNALNMHINKYHLHKWQVYCEYCGKLFTNRGNYAGHIRSNHTGEKPFECKECLKRFYNNGDLKKHCLHVHSNEPQTCEVCFKIFRSIISLRRHKKIHVAIRERKFECSFENCDKKFLTNALLQQHQKVHVGQKDYRCNACGCEYFKNAELKRHIRSIHMKIKLKCEIPGCKSQFARKETYRNHVLSHHKDIGEFNVKMLLEKIRDFQLPEPQLEVGYILE